MTECIDRQAVLDAIWSIDPENDGSDGGTVVLQNQSFTSADIEGIICQIPTVDLEALPIVKELREKLERVTMERDTAIKDRAELADFELTACEQFCFGDRKHDIPPCEWNRFGRCKLREWSGPVAENATTKQRPKECEDCTHCEVCGMVWADKSGPCIFREPGRKLRTVQMIVAKSLDKEELPHLLKAIRDAPMNISTDEQTLERRPDHGIHQN